MHYCCINGFLCKWDGCLHSLLNSLMLSLNWFIFIRNNTQPPKSKENRGFHVNLKRTKRKTYKFIKEQSKTVAKHNQLIAFSFEYIDWKLSGNSKSLSSIKTSPFFCCVSLCFLEDRLRLVNYIQEISSIAVFIYEQWMFFPYRADTFQ